MAGKSVRTITEHILNQDQGWALGGRGEERRAVKSKPLPSGLCSWEPTQAAGPSAVTPDLQDSRLRLQHPEKFKSFAAGLRARQVRSHLPSPLRLVTSHLPPCCPSCGWAVSPVLWGGFEEQMGIPLRRWKKASGTERKGRRLKEESCESSK